MIYVLGGGGGSAYAFIIATYPEGSVITCTNSVGKRKLSSTKIIFYVKKPRNGETQTCHVECHLGEDSASKDVEITYEGQSVSIFLSYAYILWTAGDGLASFQTLFETTSRYGSMYASGNNVIVSGTWDQDYSGVISKINAIVLPAGAYSTLAITSKVLSGYGNMWIEIGSTQYGSAVSSWHIPNNGYSDTDFVVRNFAIPSYMTNCYIKFYSINGHSMEISDIRFVR